MDRDLSPRKKLKSPIIDPITNLNTKTSVTCVNVPESLFDATAAKKHFSKFGRVQKIRLFPKKFICIIEYDQPMAAQQAVLNAGAYDGFMFDVTRTKVRVRRRSKRDEDPDWVPDSDVEEELSAMRGGPTYRVSRQKPMEIGTETRKLKMVKQVLKKLPARSKVVMRESKPMSQPSSGIETPVVTATSQTSLTTQEAAVELNNLRSRVSLTPDEQWRTLDARDRILRAWGGAGSRLKVGGATIGTCPDMCPEKELLHRQAEHQVMTLETVPESDGQLESWRAVKQYSRSSADQEIPMCYELRPASVLMRTTAYLLHEVADTKRQVTLADWFHFMWDRFRGIRKDITQQALCCAESIRLVEICARFHAHCAARLADLEHTQFDQKLNTDNLTKCLQTLKHMYADVSPDERPREAEFRGYIALLNLGDANFWWEIKQLPLEIQKSEDITFAIKIFNALDNNNYVRFFRLVNENASYLQACILLRYFNDVRARALARIVKAYSPRGGSRFPAEDLMNALQFESVECMRSFVNHYGLRFSKDEYDLSIILDRNQFIEDSDPYPISRAVQLIESKRINTIGEVIAGGQLPNHDYRSHSLNNSFTRDGKLKDSALVAEDQGYNTVNDSNKDIQALKTEIQKYSHGRGVERTNEPKQNLFSKPEPKSLSPAKTNTSPIAPSALIANRSFSFKPAIPVAPTEVIKNSPEKIFNNDVKNIFSFSKPENTMAPNTTFRSNDVGNLFKFKSGKGSHSPSKPSNKDHNVFAKITDTTNETFKRSQGVFNTPHDLFKIPESEKPVFAQSANDSKIENASKSVFSNTTNKSIFSRKEDTLAKPNVFGGNIFAKPESESITKPGDSVNIFAQAAAAAAQDDTKNPSTIFSSFNKSGGTNIFMKPQNSEQKTALFTPNGDASSAKLSPGSLFKSAVNTDGKGYSIFQSKNKAQTVADSIFNSVAASKSTVFDFNQNEDQIDQTFEQSNEEQLKKDMEITLQEKMRKEEEQKLEQLRQEEERRKEEERVKEEKKRRDEEKRQQEELKQLEEKRRREEEKKQEELKRKLEEERKAELKRKAEEEENKFKERVEKESVDLIEELINEIGDEAVKEILIEEVDRMKRLMSYATFMTDEICTELCNEVSQAEMKAEKIWTDKLMKKWFYVWKTQLLRNYKRRCLLEDTPVWLTDKTPIEEAACLRRVVEKDALKHMNAIHRGYRFSGELKQLPSPEPYNIMEIIKSPLLKRMKQIRYPYDKCIFWKVSLISPGSTKCIFKKIEIEKWLADAFSDKKNNQISDTLLRVEKLSWNHLMDFAISVSLISRDNKISWSEAIEGTNALLFYATEKDTDLIKTIEETLKQKYPYQVVPVAIIMPRFENSNTWNHIEEVLNSYVNRHMIACFKIFLVDSTNICDSLDASSKRALKWLAKKYPQTPPLETDYLKSVCERYLGNEIWYRLRSERDDRMKVIMKDLYKLVLCYNAAVDKLTDVITNEDLFNYPPFPLEFREYLDHLSPYPKPYEFIPTNARNSNNTNTIKDMMQKLKLPDTFTSFQPKDVLGMQNQIRSYCNQIGWFEEPERIVCKVVSLLPRELSDVDMPCEQFIQHFQNYDLIDFINILVYEKINSLNNFDNRFVVYEKSMLGNYKNALWLYQTPVLLNVKHEAVDYDDIDVVIEAKRRKIAQDSMEILMLEDKDCTMVEESIKASDVSIAKYNNYKDTVQQLECQIEEERKKSANLENLLKSALSNFNKY